MLNLSIPLIKKIDMKKFMPNYKHIYILFFIILLSACTKHKAKPANGDYLGTHTEVGGYIYEAVTGLRVANAKITLYEGKTGNGLFANYYEVDSIRSNKNGEYHFNYIPKENRFYAMGVGSYYHLGNSQYAHYPIADYYKTTDYNIALIPRGYIKIHVIPSNPNNVIGITAAAYCNNCFAFKNKDTSVVTYGSPLNTSYIYWKVQNLDSLDKFYGDSVILKPHDTLQYNINY
jgi:hypothetical protein